LTGRDEKEVDEGWSREVWHLTLDHQSEAAKSETCSYHREEDSSSGKARERR